MTSRGSDRDVSRSSAVTHGIRIDVYARYSPEHSDPQHDLWFFLYTVRMTNQSAETVQLASRHWIITDATGRIEEVRGPGVVGEHPVLEPGESFEYTSGCPLPTPFGSMRGSYQFSTRRGDPLDVEIAPFDLRQPTALH